MYRDLVIDTYYPTFNPTLYPFDMSLMKAKTDQKVLIIDDDPDMLDILRAVLQKDEKLKIFTAMDPYAAMDMMAEQAFDLIVLDWNLPNLNGLETLLATEKCFKFDPNLPLEWHHKKVNVIVLSSNDKSECKVHNTRHFRYSGYINKGKDLETIVSSLKNFFRKAA